MKRHGNHIRVSTGITATEGFDGLPTLTVKKNGKVRRKYRGSSLIFSQTLTPQDKKYLESLCDDNEEVRQ